MTIAIDFDGTCVSHEFPKIGKDIGAVPVLRELLANGHNLILYTMRSDKGGLKDDYLSQAVEWCYENRVDLYEVNRNSDQYRWTKSTKVYAHLYIDDAALGIPLKTDNSISEKPFVDWVEVRKLLVKQGFIK